MLDKFFRRLGGVFFPTEQLQILDNHTKIALKNLEELSKNYNLLQSYMQKLDFRLEKIGLDQENVLIEVKKNSIQSALNLNRQVSRPYYAFSDKWGLTQLSNGLPFFINRQTRDIAPWILLGGTWENFVDDLLSALAEPGDCFLDIGVNLGYYTIKIGNQIGPEGHVFCFEPNPEMCEIIRENISINGFYDRVTLINAGAANAAGRLSFVVDASHPGGGTIYAEGQKPEGVESISVPVVTIDESLPDDRVVDLIKIDVEGFEAMVFDGMARTLARSPEAAIITEFNYVGWGRFGDPVEMLLRYAGDRRLFRIFHDGRLQETDKAALAEDMSGNVVCYFLMLPQTTRRTHQIDQYLKRFAASA